MKHGVHVQTILSHNRRENWGWKDQRPFKLFRQVEEIEHATTQVERPQSSGSIERLHPTLLEEHLRSKGGTTRYDTIEELQKDLEGDLRTATLAARTATAGWRAGRPKRSSRRGSPERRSTGSSEPGRRSRPQRSDDIGEVQCQKHNVLVQAAVPSADGKVTWTAFSASSRL